MELIKDRINTTIKNLETLISSKDTLNQIDRTAQLIISSIKSGNKLIICGNGGSAADAQHVAGEFVCKFYKDRDPLPAIALTTDTSILTSISNDYSYNDVFSRQVKALGKKGDILLGISTSASSHNVLNAFIVAQKIGIVTVLLTGATEREICNYSNIVIKAPSNDTPSIQSIHLLIEHIICEIVEQAFYE